jgi:hypothetical protein
MALGALLISNETFAQGKPGAKPNQHAKNKQEMSPEQRAQHSADKAEKRYALKPDQKSEWQSAAMQHAVENQNLRMRMKGSTTPEERKEIRHMARENKNQFVERVNMFLDAEQKAKFEKDRQEMEQKRKARMKNKKQAEDNSDLED